MAHMRVEQYVVGAIQTNCYFAVNEDTNEAIVIDPGDEAARLIRKLQDNKLNPISILLTHGHFDHATGAAELAAKFQIPVYAHEEERVTLEDPDANLSGWNGAPCKFHADVFVRDGQEMELAGFRIHVLFTPGHTAGGCCYYFPDEKVLFSGDTLFHLSVGRTDFPGGGMSTLVRSVQEKLMPLPDDVAVYPGHNDTTTIGTERAYNPYL